MWMLRVIAMRTEIPQFKIDSYIEISHNKWKLKVYNYV